MSDIREIYAEVMKTCWDESLTRNVMLPPVATHNLARELWAAIKAHVEAEAEQYTISMGADRPFRGCQETDCPHWRAEGKIHCVLTLVAPCFVKYVEKAQAEPCVWQERTGYTHWWSEHLLWWNVGCTGEIHNGAILTYKFCPYCGKSIECKEIASNE